MRKLKGIDGRLDTEFGKLVKERCDWHCERCRKDFPNRDAAGGSRGLDWSHFWTRHNRSVRWHGDNCFGHCTGCHGFLGGNPHEFSVWVREQLGETRYDALTLRANKPRKYTMAEKKEMLEHFKAQREYILRRRREGETGYIDFVDWD